MGFGAFSPHASRLENCLPVETIRWPQRHRSVFALLCAFFVFSIPTPSSMSEASIVLIPAAENFTDSDGIGELGKAVGLTSLTESFILLKKDEDGVNDRLEFKNINPLISPKKKRTPSDTAISGWDEIIAGFNRMSTELRRRRGRRSPPIKKPDTCAIKKGEMEDFIKVLEKFLDKSKPLEDLTQSSSSLTIMNADDCQTRWNQIKSQVIDVIKKRIEMETAKSRGELQRAEKLNSELQEDTKKLLTEFDDLKKKVDTEQQKELTKLNDLLTKEAERNKKLEEELKIEKNSHRNTKIKFIISKIQQDDWETAAAEFKQIFNFTFSTSQEAISTVEYIVREAYNNNRAFTKKVHKFNERLPELGLRLYGEIALYDLVVKTNDLNALDTSFILEWNYYVNEIIPVTISDLFPVKTSWERIRRELNKTKGEIVERLAKEIVNGDYKNTRDVSLEISHNVFMSVIGDLIPTALGDLHSGGILTRVRNVIRAIDATAKDSKDRRSIDGIDVLYKHLKDNRPLLIYKYHGEYRDYYRFVHSHLRETLSSICFLNCSPLEMTKPHSKLNKLDWLP